MHHDINRAPGLVALLGRTRAEGLGALRVPRTTSKPGSSPASGRAVTRSPPHFVL
ncbi:hypothetical protein ACWEOG_32510 [Amycolatopsis japonica]